MQYVSELLTVPNMVLLLAGVTVQLAAVALIVYLLIRRLGIKSIGPIQIEQNGTVSMHSMTKATEREDETCRKQMRYYTGVIKRRIGNIFANLEVCTLAKVALASVIRFPMYESIANNHFTSELMPENYAEYRKRIIDMVRDEYDSLALASRGIQCNREALPPWEDIGGQIVTCIDMWLRYISREVIACCKKKRTIYEEYLVSFEAAGDDFRADITKHCIEKNKRYITVLKTRIGEEG